MKRKSMLPTPDDLTLDEIQSRFGTDEKARRYLEEIRWPNGVVCPHCKIDDQKRIWKIEENPEKKIRAGLYQCAECKAQFTVTVGTIFEDSHIPLRKWLVAWYLLCSSKKGISSLQIQRMLGLGSYRTALFMKRGIMGTFHQVSKKHLPLYLAEFDHRFNHRKDTDGQRTVSALKCAEGKRLTLKPLKRGRK